MWRRSWYFHLEYGSSGGIYIYRPTRRCVQLSSLSSSIHIDKYGGFGTPSLGKLLWSDSSNWARKQSPICWRRVNLPCLEPATGCATALLHNKLHPTHEAVTSQIPLVCTYSLLGELVLDPFCGSASTCAAALLTGRRYVGIEMDSEYHANATARMQRIHERIARKRSSYSIPRKGDFACVPTRLKA